MPPLTLWTAVNVCLLVVAYLLGAFPTGYLLCRWLRGIDIRTQGSGSTGATNVLRTLGKGPGLTVLLVDIAKGAAAIALTQWAYAPGSGIGVQATAGINLDLWLPWLVIGTGLAAILGHSKPIWLNFNGGKSVATSLGILLMLNWIVGVATLAVFTAMLGVSRIVSLSSITGAIALPILMVACKQPLAYVLFAIVGGLYVIWRHWTNIQRLLAGTEPRLGPKSPAS